MRIVVVGLLSALAAPAFSQDACSQIKLALLAETQNVGSMKRRPTTIGT